MMTTERKLKHDVQLDGCILKKRTMVTVAVQGYCKLVLCHYSGWYAVDDSYFYKEQSE